MIQAQQSKMVWVYRDGFTTIAEFDTIQECGVYEAWRPGGVGKLTRTHEARPVGHPNIIDLSAPLQQAGQQYEPTQEETKIAGDPCVFLDGTFISAATVALTALAEVIARPEPNTQMEGYTAQRQKNEADLSAVAFGLATGFVRGLDGIGRALERAALANERLADFAAMDVKATIEGAIADKIEAEKANAVEAYKKSTSERNFIGKGP